MNYSERLDRLGTETAFKVLGKINNFPEERKKNIISFGIGEPDFDSPDHIKKAGIKAIKQNYTHYTVSAGLPELREAVANFVSKTKNIDITSENVVILPGAKFTVDLTILSCTNPGDEIIYPNPGYPIYESLINVHGCKPIPAQLWETKEWNYDIDELREKITSKTRMIIINSPHNPTGSILNEKNLKILAQEYIQLEETKKNFAGLILKNFKNLDFSEFLKYPKFYIKEKYIKKSAKSSCISGLNIISVDGSSAVKKFMNVDFSFLKAICVKYYFYNNGESAKIRYYPDLSGFNNYYLQGNNVPASTNKD